MKDELLLGGEIWKDIPGYEGYYQVSNLGRIKSSERISYNHGKFPFLRREKILKLGVCRGYLTVGLSRDGKGKNKTVHQIVAMAFLGHKPCGYEKVVNHINHIKTDNRVENLEIVSNRKNTNQKHLPSLSKYTGVTWHKGNKKWQASIIIDGKRLYLGQFEIEKEAAQAYLNALDAHNSGNEIIIKRPKFSSKYKGLSWNKASRVWTVRKVIDGKTVYLGSYKDELYAANVYINN